MAEKVDAFPKALRSNETWDPVADGSIWKLDDDDLKRYASRKSAIASVRYYARQHSLKVRTQEHEGALYVQLSPKGTGKSEAQMGDELRRARRRRAIEA